MRKKPSVSEGEEDNVFQILKADNSVEYLLKVLDNNGMIQ
jgi:hypothetical protein